jgi:hypothetical protein
MVPLLIVLVILSLSVGLLRSWRRNRKLLAEARSAGQVRADQRTNELEKANEDLRTAQTELQRRWQYLAEAQRLSHSGTFGWKVRSGELTWSDETYRILGFTRETNPTLDLVFDRIHPEDLDRVQQLSVQNSGMRSEKARITMSTFGFVGQTAPSDFCVASDITTPRRKLVNTSASRWI